MLTIYVFLYQWDVEKAHYTSKKKYLKFFMDMVFLITAKKRG